METKTVKLYSLDYSNARTYLMAALVPAYSDRKSVILQKRLFRG